MNRWLIYFIFILSLFLFSCSKEKDNFRPTINITSPYHLQNINGIDTIKINATIKDNHNIESVQVSLRDQNNNVVLSTINRTPNTSTYEINEWFFLDDIHLPSGQYYFSFSASDGTNTALETVDVEINEHPKLRQGIFIADNNGSTTNITYLSNSYTSSFYNSYSGNFLGIYVNSYHQQLNIAPSSTGNLTAVNLSSSSNAWSTNVLSTLTGFYSDQEYSYVGQYDGNLKRYNTSGAFNFHGTAISNFYIEEIATHENYLVTEQQAIATSDVQLALTWLSSGAPFQQATINEDVLGIYSMNSNTIVLLTNNSSNLGNLIFYDISTGLPGSPFSINTGNIDACVEISTGIYLVAENGDLTTINAGNFSKSTYLNGVTANNLKYDYLTNELFVINGNQITIYDYSGKTVKGNYSHGSAIIDLDFWYNK